jgi:hypothetical protein
MTLLVRTSSRQNDNQYGGARQADNIFQANTGAALSSFVDESFHGVGTLYADRKAAQVEEANKTGSPLSFDDYKLSDDFRQGVGYYGGMTKESAKVLAEYSDEQAARGEIINRATTGQTIAGYGAALGLGVFEPKNLAIGIGTAAVLGPLGMAAPAVGRMRQLANLRRVGGGYGAKMGAGATEGLISAAIAEPSNRHSAGILQQDYTMADSLFNVATSTILGAGLHAAPSFIKDRFTSSDKVKALDTSLAELDMATNQLVMGQKVDVSPVERSQDVFKSDSVTAKSGSRPFADIDRKIDTMNDSQRELRMKMLDKKAEAAIITPREMYEREAISSVKRYIDSPEFKKKFEGSKAVDESGLPIRVYHGSPTAKTIDKFDLSRGGSNTFKGVDDVGIHFTNDPEIAQGYSKADEYQKIDGDFVYQGEKKNAARGIVAAHLNIKNPAIYSGELSVTKNSIDMAKALGHDGIIWDKGSGVKEFIAFSPDQVIPAFVADDTLAIAKRIDAENKAALQKSAIDAMSPLNDTAIDTKAISQLDEYAATGADTTPEADFNSYMDEIRSMREQELITDKEFEQMLDAVDSLNEADIKQIHTDLYACLTRG